MSEQIESTSPTSFRLDTRLLAQVHAVLARYNLENLGGEKLTMAGIIRAFLIGVVEGKIKLGANGEITNLQ